MRFDELKNVCDFNRGQSIVSKDAIVGDIPVISGGKKPAFYHNQANRPANTITVAGSGAYAGYVSFHTIPIFAGDCFSVDIKDDKELNKKYLYYYLSDRQDLIYNKKTGAGIPHVHGKDIANFVIPLPSLQVQETIVSVLDKYNDLCYSLTNGLPKEIELVSKQYEYYRNKLLSFKEKKL